MQNLLKHWTIVKSQHNTNTDFMFLPLNFIRDQSTLIFNDNGAKRDLLRVNSSCYAHVIRRRQHMRLLYVYGILLTSDSFYSLFIIWFKIVKLLLYGKMVSNSDCPCRYFCDSQLCKNILYIATWPWVSIIPLPAPIPRLYMSNNRLDILNGQQKYLYNDYSR